MRHLFCKYDVFISHAVEDKLSIANELCIALEERGLTIWYSGRELNAGDSIQYSIQEGLNKSAFGVIVFSPIYIEKTWTLREFYFFIPEHISQVKRIIPIFHNGITAKDLAAKDLVIADIFAIDSVVGVDVVADKVVQAIKHEKIKRWKLFLRRVAFALMLPFLSFLALYFYRDVIVHPITEDEVQFLVEQHFKISQEKIDQQKRYRNDAEQGRLSEAGEANKLFTAYNAVGTHYKNECYFLHDGNVINTKKRVEAALGVEIKSLNPLNSYGFDSSTVFVYDNARDKNLAQYAFFNARYPHFKISEIVDSGRGIYKAMVSISDNIRSVSISLHWPRASDQKRQQISFSGFTPVEDFYFVRKGDEWVLLEEDPGVVK